MRFGNWRGMTLAAGLASALLMVAFGLSSTPAHAQDVFHTIPRVVDAVDVNTGGPYYAPPIPSGHYAKDPIGTASSHLHGLLGRLHGPGLGAGLCGLCGGRGCNSCGGTGHSLGAGDPGAGLGHGGGCGLCGGRGCGACLGHASTVVPCSQSVPAPPVVASSQCSDPGCGLLGKHHHKGCGLCGGRGTGCGGCAVADGCSACGGKGCGLCGGRGPCGACGGRGCGLCAGAAAGAHGLVNHLLGRDKIKWFVGPGGPVPLTPGYTPYINVTRSPRDFFAFPPMTP